MSDTPAPSPLPPHGKELAVIILNWNGLDLLRRFIPAAAEHTRGPEVDLIVADNGSDDGSLEWLRREWPEVKTLELGANYGFAGGYNRAIAATGYPFTVLLNSDVEVTPGWWRPLLRFLRSNPEAGAVQPKVKSWRNKAMFEYAGAAGGFLDRLGYPYCRGRLFDSLEADTGQYDGVPARVAWASGAALAVRTEAYRAAGGLDEAFFAHMEEIDLCCRMQAAGFSVWALSDSEVFHVGGASLEQGNPRKTYLNFRNNLLLLHKNLPAARGRKVLLWRRLADTLAFFMYAAKLDFANARAVVKAHRDFKTMRGQYASRPETDILSRLPGWNRWAVLDRYLLRKKK